ncbi:alcohol dehydrogenase catalytic domain-containing protein [Bradyrhizobium betae]|uniref:alcohol dehydrogenase catalytic domain-containing protein n=1 Tax=Bradyrhizobium betae TaxID=244734 RepID=UPI003D670DB5
MRAAGINRADILQRTGAYGNQSFGESNLLGLELAGEVVGVGSEVDDVSIGERVMAIVGGEPMPSSPGSTATWRSGFQAMSHSSRARRLWNRSSRRSKRSRISQESGRVKPCSFTAPRAEWARHACRSRMRWAPLSTQRRALRGWRMSARSARPL